MKHMNDCRGLHAKFNAVLRETDEKERIRKATLLILYISRELNFGRSMKRKSRLLVLNHLAALTGLLIPNAEIEKLAREEQSLVSSSFADLTWEP